MWNFEYEEFTENIGKIVYYNDKLYKLVREYEDGKDMSYHGSPWYYTYMDLLDLETDEVIKVCKSDNKNNIKFAIPYIKKLEEKINEIQYIIDFGVSR